MERPVKVKPYWIVEPTSAIQNRSFRQFRGIGTNQTSTSAAIAKRILINNNGGNSSRPALATTNPNAQLNGTKRANKNSRAFIIWAELFLRMSLLQLNVDPTVGKARWIS